jgi:hypothetical protein
VEESMKSLEQLMTEGAQLSKAAKIIAKKTMELKADLANQATKPPEHILEAIQRDCFYLDMFADNLFLDLRKLSE